MKLIEQIVNEIKLQIFNEVEKSDKTIIAIYPGRFQPMGAHHKASYDWLAKQFGEKNTYIVTSDKTDPQRSPFNFKEKKSIINKHGIKNIVKVINPYNPQELLKKFDPKKTVVVYMIGEKDAGRLSSYKRLMKYNKTTSVAYKDLENPYAYYIYAPHVSYKIPSFGEMSGTNIRKALGDRSAKLSELKSRFKSIMGWFDPEIFNMVVSKMNTNRGKLRKESEALPIVKREFWDKVFEEVLKEDTVICEECGESMKQIQYRHLKYKHNMTIEEYTKKYPNSKLVSESAKNYGQKNPMNLPGVREKHITKMNTPELKEVFSKNAKNRVVKEETRLKCSKNNSMNDPENRKKVSEKLKETYSNNPDLIEVRRDAFKKIRNSEEYKKRMIELGYWRNEEDIPKFESYRNEVRELTENTYQKYFNEISNAKLRSRENHLDHKISIAFGFKNGISPEIISHHSNLEVIPRHINESKFTKNSISPEKLYELINNSSNKIDARQLLMCGGVAGHMTHPFEDMGLTFGDLKEMFKLGLSGEISISGNPTEKLDGQNLFVTFRNGKLYAARNKGDIKSGGMDYKSIKTKFAGRGDIEEAFTYAFEDLESAVKKLTEKQQGMIFKDGTAWMNLEIMYPKSANVINYDGAYLVFHGVSLYNKDGEKVKDYNDYAKVLAGMIRQVNQDTQKTFSIAKPKVLNIAKTKNYRERLKYFTSKITELQKQMNCKDSDTLGMWHQRWWEKYINKNAERLGVKVEDSVMNGLVKRWAFYDKSFSLNSKNIENPELLSWAKQVDSTTLKDQLKKNIKPFETLVLRFGAEILKNVSDVMALNPEKTTEKIRSDVKMAIDKLSKSNDVKDLEVLKTQLSRIKAAGGMKSIVPLEGIVFNFKGKTYKLTGAFAPINQLLGYFKFG